MEGEVATTAWSSATHLPWWKRYRLVEWVATTILLIILVAIGRFGSVHCRDFSWNDGSLNHELLPDTFPSWALFPIAALPATVYVGASLRYPIGHGAGVEQAVALCLMQLSSVTLAELITEPVKLMAGRLRPDFFARLRAEGVVPPTDPLVIQTTMYSYCNVTSAAVKEGRKSFPSGHSAVSFSGMTPLALYLLHRFGSVRRASLLRLIAGASPLALAFVVAVSRTWDYHHHFADILAGSVIGCFAGFVAFRTFMERVADRGESEPLHLPLYDGGGNELAERVPKFTLRRYDALNELV